MLEISESFCMRNIFCFEFHHFNTFYMSLLFTPLSVSHPRLDLSAATAAERAIALITRFARAALDDAELEWLLQTVEDHRKRVNAMNKSKLGTP